MSRCEYVPLETGARCPLEAQIGSRYCVGCQAPAARVQAQLEHWMQEVEVALERLCGLHPNDLPDCPYADWQQMGMTPDEAARQCLARFVGEDTDA